MINLFNVEPIITSRVRPSETPNSPASSQASATPLSMIAPEKGVAEKGDKTDMGKGKDNGRFDSYDCQTCKTRKYTDGSDDPSVSFKTPTTISADRAASAVKSHEMEHVFNERSRAMKEDKKVISQNVMIHTAICAECGDTYVSGGTTTTVTRSNGEKASEKPAQNQQAEQSSK